MLLEIDEMDDDLCRMWIGKLVSQDKNPLHYAQAFEYKTHNKDTPHRFFAWMLREDKVEDVCGKSVKIKAGWDAKKTNRVWPYPKGHNRCNTCKQGAGWYPVYPDEATDEQIEAMDLHEAAGLKAIPHLTGFVFLCLECNPKAEIDPFYAKVAYPAYPIGGAPTPSNAGAPGDTVSSSGQMEEKPLLRVTT